MKKNLQVLCLYGLRCRQTYNPRIITEGCSPYVFTGKIYLVFAETLQLSWVDKSKQMPQS